MSSSRQKFLSRFRSNQRGAVAIVFALTIVTLVSAGGLAVDYARAYSVAGKLRSAADSAALAGAKMLDVKNMSNVQIKSATDAYFQAQIKTIAHGAVTATPLEIQIDRTQSTVTVSSDISVLTMFGGVVSIPSLDFSVDSTVVYKVKRVELAMVLDVTGSMTSGGRLDAMKTSAKNIIDTLVNETTGKNNKIALVPYSASVNVGSYRHVASGGDSADGCVMERLFPANRDTDETPGGSNNFAVNGQLNSNDNGRYVCPNAVLMPLSKDATALRDKIDSYNASGWTAGHIGLAWGWNVISPKWSGVFAGESEPGDYDDDRYVKAVILMTDGSFNTSYTAGTSQSEQQEESRNRTLALCDNMKANDIEIFTVAFEAPTDAQTLLQSCASSLSYYFNATDSTQLNAAFQTIADNLRSMRVTE